MADPLSPLRLDERALAAVRDALSDRLGRGLAAEGQEIKALPAWLPQPAPDANGRAVVVDTGGTNMRAALVELRQGQPPRISQQSSGEVPRDPERRVGAEDFFRLQAELVASLEPPPELPVGYCFSYPTASAPDGDAVLLHWTKGIQIQGVVGSRVGDGLRGAMTDLGLRPGRVRVLNDTVAALMAGAWSHSGEAESVGLIVGTGTNMAAFLRRDGSPRMAVNLESGNFHPPGLSDWDDELDRVTDNPGLQRFEKAVSGYYLPYLFRRVFPNYSALSPADGAGPLGELRRRSGPKATAAALLLDRSADLVGAAVAGLCDHLPSERPVRVVAEGSLFWRSPGYRDRATRTAQRLIRGIRPLDFVAVEHANLVGSACAALLD